MTKLIRISVVAALLAAGGAWSAKGQDELPPPEPQAAGVDMSAETPEGMEVLTSGPLHEAFADAVRYKAEPGITVDREPPAPVEEQPPEARPEGADVVWIPGYWGWDDEANDFIWITGVYRNRPPGYRWVPGYWADATVGQWQWVSGFWVPDQQQDVAYLPEPPASLDQGPSSPSPGSNYFWNPGCWNWNGGDYAWRAGFWTVYRPGWVWYPTYYSWTPSGYVCCYGRWDRPWATRGLCFAPVRYTQPLYLNSGYYYRPSVCFNTAAFAWNLFIRPGYGHYYVGNYGGAPYQRYGYRPWYAYGRSGFGYDPFYNYYRWSNGRNNPSWENDIRNRYDRLQANGGRGPRDFRDYRRDYDRLDQRDRVAMTLTQLERNGARNGGDVPRVVRTENRQQFQDMSRQFRELNDRRRQTEVARNGNVPTQPTRGEQVNPGAQTRLELPPAERTRAQVNANVDRTRRATQDAAERRREFTNAERNRASRAGRQESLRPDIDRQTQIDQSREAARNRAAENAQVRERTQAIENANRARNAAQDRARATENANRNRSLEQARESANAERARSIQQERARVQEQVRQTENAARAREFSNQMRRLNIPTDANRPDAVRTREFQNRGVPQSRPNYDNRPIRVTPPTRSVGPPQVQRNFRPPVENRPNVAVPRGGGAPSAPAIRGGSPGGANPGGGNPGNQGGGNQGRGGRGRNGR